MTAVDTNVLPGWDVLDRAARVQGSYNLSFWDAMIIAGPYSLIDGLQIVNPFKPS
jgi:predicted nucleic acid-binding protein